MRPLRSSAPSAVKIRRIKTAEDAGDAEVRAYGHGSNASTLRRLA
jgi:hypothetical protein